MKIGILVYESVDLLDVGGPYEVFLTASRLAAREGKPAPFDVVTLGLTGEAVTSYGGLRLIPQAVLDDVHDLDLLIVPGSIEIDKVTADDALLGAVERAMARTSYTASVCTGAFVLGKLGALEGRQWTTHWEDVALLSERVGGEGTARVRWIDSGDVITSGGLSAGIAMALHLVDRFAGSDLAVRTANQLEYDWRASSRPS